MPVEGGVAGGDGGSAGATDASIPDASLLIDAGNSAEAEVEVDATDASTPDASASNGPAGTGGCNCRAIATHPTKGTAIPFVLLALALACRRRSNVGR